MSSYTMQTTIEQNLFGEDRFVTVSYQLPEDQWDTMKIKAVKLFRAVNWSPAGEPLGQVHEVDLLPVLGQWELQYIEERIHAILKEEAEQERLAA